MSASGVAFNSVLMLAVALPSVWWVRWLLSVCNFDAVADAQPPSLGLELLMKQGHALAFDKEWMCGLYYHRPVVFENIVFFLNVDVLFWLISLAQRSTWLIDPWWQFAPVGILAFIGTHPRARLGPRAFGASLCLLVWAARLTHNYFRRERWAVGRQEDWRYADMRRRFGRNWSWISFFAGYIAQHPMLVGLTLPLYPAFGLDLQDPLPPFSVMDWAAFVVCAAGISVGFVADNQLFAYMKANATRSSDEKLKVLDSGLWALSRHPNHLGEQLFWVGLLLVALGQGATWCAFGVLYNHSIDTFVTLHLIEGRMLSQNDRAAEYRRYMERTPILVPWLLISPMGSGSSRQQRQKAR